MKPLFLALLVSLTIGRITATDIHQPEGQGFHLHVTKLVGNHMPGPGIGPGIGVPGIQVPEGMNPGRGHGFPLKNTEVLVFQGKIKPMQDPAEAKKHKAFHTKAVTDDEGKVSIPLPPGRYTLVAVIKGKCYRNGFDGQGNWASLELKEGDWMKTWIRDTSEAAF